MRPRLFPAAREDTGQAAVFTVLLMAVVIACFGLVWDAGRMLLDKSAVMSIAHEAARAGAAQTDVAATMREGVPVLDEAAAADAAHGYLRAAGAQGSVRVHEGSVTVLAQRRFTVQVLPLGERSAEAEATASALDPLGAP